MGKEVIVSHLAVFKARPLLNKRLLAILTKQLVMKASSETTEVEIETLKTLSTAILHEDNLNRMESRDPDDRFVMLGANQLKSFNSRNNLRLKHEINNFKCRIGISFDQPSVAKLQFRSFSHFDTHF